MGNWSLKRHIKAYLKIIIGLGLLVTPIIFLFFYDISNSGDGYMAAPFILLGISFLIIFVISVFIISSILRKIVIRNINFGERSIRLTYFASIILSLIFAFFASYPLLTSVLSVRKKATDVAMDSRIIKEQDNYYYDNFSERLSCPNSSAVEPKDCEGIEVSFTLRAKREGIYNVEVYIDSSRHSGNPLFYAKNKSLYSEFSSYKANEKRNIKVKLYPNLRPTNYNLVGPYDVYLHFWEGTEMFGDYKNGILFTGNKSYINKKETPSGGGYMMPVVYDPNLVTKDYSLKIFTELPTSN